MIKRLEIKNFENHEHTIIDNFSDGFNLICGPSDSGKTSIVRAISVIAYNDFDHKSIRVGHTTCEITITTERGMVKAVRGKKVNNWEVTPIGEETKIYNNIGRTILDDAAEIIGLQVVNLGDVSIKANVMGQLESHFMMSQIDGKNATGSIRAQIIDEISGLTGIETVIRDVSLDNKRNAKQIKDAEEENVETELKLHNEEILNKEEELLDEVKDLMQQYDSITIKKEEVVTLLNDSNRVNDKIGDIEKVLSKLPDVINIINKTKHTDTTCKEINNADILLNEYNVVKKIIDDSKAVLSKLPDAINVENRIQNVDMICKEKDVADELWGNYIAIKEKVNAGNKILNELANIDEINELDLTERKILEVIEIKSVIGEYNKVKEQEKSINKKLKTCVNELEIDELELNELLGAVKICPVFLTPITESCKPSKKGRY